MERRSQILFGDMNAEDSRTYKGTGSLSAMFIEPERVEALIREGFMDETSRCPGRAGKVPSAGELLSTAKKHPGTTLDVCLPGKTGGYITGICEPFASKDDAVAFITELLFGTADISIDDNAGCALW